ncbi:MAG: hypothetical protein RBT16_11320, partial [Desulfococcus multivorans]|nr:hypothetical protein [Desulfococcus multivorans]
MGKTNSAENAKLQYEAGQELNAMAAMVDAGDHKEFSVTGVSLWSQRSGYEPEIYPDGLATGGAVTAGSGNDTVSVSALTCYLAGALTSVAADASAELTRPSGGTPANTHNISSITINSGGAIAVVKGEDGTSFSSTRGAAGGPPLIPAGSVEIAQVKLSSATPAAVTQSEIYQVPGSSQERYDYPVWAEYPMTGKIVFASALPAIHEGSPATYKGVYAEVYEPVFADLEPVSDFVPPENSHSVNSTQVYGGTIGSSSSSLNQGSFKVFLKDGVTEPIIALKNETL